MNLATISPILFLTAAFSLATILDPIWSGMQRRQAKTMIDMMVGDGKRLFANHFVIKADAYFHNGQYPSIFRQAREEESHLAAAAESPAGHDHGDHSQCDHDGDGKPDGEQKEHSEKHEDHDHDGDGKPDHAPEAHDEHADHDSHEGHDHGDHSQCDHDGDGKPDGEHTKHAAASDDAPQDFLEKFGQHFFVSKHSHMKNSDAKELLPWFKISAELDPTRVETYTVAAFWLRNTLKKPDEAEQFLRDGWKSNPNSYAIVLELGRLYYQDRKDLERSRNLFELALKKWDQQETPKEKPDLYAREQILANLVEAEYWLKDYRPCLEHLRQLESISPYPDSVRKTIADVESKLAAQQ